MIHVVIIVMILAVLGVVAAVVYARTILTHMTVTAQAIDKPALLDGLTGLTWLNTKLLGWKTVILGWIAAATQAVAFFLSSDLSPWKDLPWTLVFEQRIANYITFACAMLVPLTHTMGLSRAARAAPPEE